MVSLTGCDKFHDGRDAIPDVSFEATGVPNQPTEDDRTICLGMHVMGRDMKYFLDLIRASR